MARIGTFTCSTCGRTFRMAAHLGRHKSTVHAAKAKRAVPAQDARRPSKAAAPGASHGLAAVVGVIQRSRGELAAQRAAVDAQIATLDRALQVLGAGPSARPVSTGRKQGGMSYRPGTIKAYIQSVLQARGEAMAVSDITAAVRTAGYPSKNPTLDKNVGMALAEMPDAVRVHRGVFRLR